MTGESEPVEKQETVLDGEKPLGDRVNMMYSGSFATYGRAKMVVNVSRYGNRNRQNCVTVKKYAGKETPLQESLIISVKSCRLS